MKIFLLILILVVGLAVKPPTPICRVSPLPSQIPISIGEELRFDLQRVFSGYNLFFNATAKGHISVSEKYQITEKQYGSSYNFLTTKIKAQNRFLGLVSKGAYSGIAVGVNDQQSGVTIEYYVQVEDIANLHCFDVDEIMYPGNAIAVVDCAFFHMGEVVYNEFLYVNLTSRELIEGSHFSDTFVAYNGLSKRRIEVLEDPLTGIPYLVRFNLRDGVDNSHRDQTYAEIFMMTNPLRPQLLDVIDNTFLDIPKLSIADYQVYRGLIYILAYNKGVYQLRISQNQYVFIRSRFDIQLDVTRFHVDSDGFNNDLHVVATNGNTVYQYQWDLLYPPALVAKYTLIPNSEVEQIFVDYNFVIVLAWSNINDERVRRTWVFSRSTLSYLNAYNVFHAPLTGPAIIHWDQHGSLLQIFHEYNSYNIKMNLPYMDVKPVNSSMVGLTEEYTVVATSQGDGQQTATCSEKFIFIYVLPNDTRIIKTGFWPLEQVYVDSPDRTELPLSTEFFGSNLTYNVEFFSDSPILPYQYVDKQHKAAIQWPADLNVSSIVYLEMFTETDAPGERPTAVYGLMQTVQKLVAQNIYTSHYIRCMINVFDRDETHHLQCIPISTFRFSINGRIITASHIVDPREHLIAVVFDVDPHVIMLYTFNTRQVMLYGRKDYFGDPANQVTGVAIHRGNLYVVLEYGKRVQVFLLSDVYLPPDQDQPHYVKPRTVIDRSTLFFYGITYFAPVNIKLSPFHPEVIFLKTKTGLLAININNQLFPELLFHIKTNNILYDFEINQDYVLIIDEMDTTLYELQLPLRRVDPPLTRQTIPRSFKLGDYDEVCSDRLFYIVGNQSVYVINPKYRSISALYTEIWVADPIESVDAVNIFNKEVLFIRTKKEVTAWVLAEDATLFIEWTPNSYDFTFNLSAFNRNRNATMDPYSLKVHILDTNETIIKPTPAFNQTFVKQLGKIKTDKSNKTFSANIQLNDSEWFSGNVMRYHLNCSDCGGKVQLTNHVNQTRELVEGRSIYDMESTLLGIYAQQYSSIFRTNTFNDSISFINMVPTEHQGEICTKIAVGEQQHFVLSLCELGTAVNVYVTSHVGSKSFTFGPYPTDAKAVNHAQLVGDILMIVDNDDDPFLRAGGIYLYALDYDFDNTNFLNFLDYIDYQDLQIQGYQGKPYIGSADLHRPDIMSETEYRLFVTQARTGSIFIFGFEVSPDGEQVIYLSKKYVYLANFIPTELKYPTPLRVNAIKIHYRFEVADKKSDYYLFLTVANWHHMQLLITLNQNDDILAFKLERLFERFPWKLGNYLKYKQTRGYETYFAVPYVDPDTPRQVVAVYSVPYIVNAQAVTYEQKYSSHEYTMLNGLVPIIRVFGGHFVRDSNQVAFAFHTFGNDKLLFTDVDGYNITELTLFRNLTLTVNELDVAQQEVQIIALNPYTNFTFNVNLDFHKDKDDDEEEKKKEQTKEILWILIVAIGGIMVVGLIIAYARQSKTLREQAERESKETLLTVDDEFHNNYLGLNRSSMDPDSVRGSIDPTPVPVHQNIKTTLRTQEPSALQQSEGQNLN